MAGIHDQHAHRDQALFLEIILHQLAPAIPLIFGNFGVTISGQVGKVDLLVHKEIVDLAGLAGGGSHAGKVLAVDQSVDHRGLAHIGTPEAASATSGQEVLLAPPSPPAVVYFS